jgi:hypothetical protein
MERQDRDDFMYALGQTMEFYGKTLDKRDFAFWYSAMGDRSVHSIKHALKEHVKVGKFAPRPANIMELLATAAPPERAALPPPVTTSCPPDIAIAWMWFIHRCAEGTQLSSLFENNGSVDIETQEKYLHVVNHEAKRLNQPESIPAEYRLAEVWG